MNVDSIIKFVGKVASQKWYQKAEHIIVLIAITYLLRDVRKKGTFNEFVMFFFSLYYIFVIYLYNII